MSASFTERRIHFYKPDYREWETWPEFIDCDNYEPFTDNVDLRLNVICGT